MRPFPIPADWQVLALSPHTDDAELGAGGLIARFRRAGVTVDVVAFAPARSLGGTDSLDEWRNSLDLLSVGPEHRAFWDYQDTQLPLHRAEILDRLVGLRDEMRPDLVLVPAPHDCHQDHQTVTQEAVRAFKRQRLLAYDLHWNTVGMSSLDWFVALSEEDVALKESALACYLGQRPRPYFEPGLMRAIARMRGEQCGERYAEAFDVLRWVW